MQCQQLNAELRPQLGDPFHGAPHIADGECDQCLAISRLSVGSLARARV
jgi:hypothetical protein